MAIFEILFKILLTFIAAFLFGIERQRMHKPVGFSTYAFVSIGACALTITALTLIPENPLSLMAAIVTGIGFLGAGALMKSGEKIWGFSSAATIWLFAIIGLLIGVGEYLLATTTYVLVWMTVLYDRHLENHGLGSYRKKIVIKTTHLINEQELKNIMTLFTKSYKLNEVSISKKDNTMTLIYYIEGTKDDINKLPKKLSEKEWFESCQIE